MAEQPLTLPVLAKFHREVILPDIERILGEAVADSEGRLRNEMYTLHDALLQRMDRIETDFESMKAGLARVEQRLDAIEGRLTSLASDHRELRVALDRLEERLGRLEEAVRTRAETGEAVRAEVAVLRSRLDGLEARVRDLEDRPD